MSDYYRKISHELGEAIRQALTAQHLPKEKDWPTYWQPKPKQFCTCKPNENKCSRLILDAAFKKYAAEFHEAVV